MLFERRNYDYTSISRRYIRRHYIKPDFLSYPISLPSNEMGPLYDYFTSSN